MYRALVLVKFSRCNDQVTDLTRKRKLYNLHAVAIPFSLVVFYSSHHKTLSSSLQHAFQYLISKSAIFQMMCQSVQRID
jgi:hypothetical protein